MAFYAHQVVIPRDPVTAKGLLLASIRDPNPVVFLEPKALYRASVAEVPVGEYVQNLSEAEIVRRGSDVTVVGWGAQMRVLEEVRCFSHLLCERCPLMQLTEQFACARRRARTPRTLGSAAS